MRGSEWFLGDKVRSTVSFRGASSLWGNLDGPPSGRFDTVDTALIVRASGRSRSPLTVLA